MKSIVVFNQKGGVGKTSTVSNLMAEFTALGKKVLAFDLDGQGNLTKFLGVDTEDQNTLRELLLKEATFNDTVVHTKYGDLIPCDVAIQNEMLRFASMPAFNIRVKKILEELKNAQKYDIVLLDCSPSVNAVTTASLIATDYVIIPTELELFSASGLAQIIDTLGQVKEINEKLSVLGILTVKYQSKRTLSQAVAEIVHQMAEPLCSQVFSTAIPAAVGVPASQAKQMSVRDYQAFNKAGIAYQNLAIEILQKISA